jgi:hypothetical protein
MARGLLQCEAMRTFLVLVVVAGLGCLYLVQKRNEQEKPAVTPTVAGSKQTAATPRPVSEHNWMKRSLDRTNEVKRQVAEQRKADGAR